MSAMAITPLDGWTRDRISQHRCGPLDLDALRAFQLRRLQKTLDRVCRKSPFYRNRFSDRLPLGLDSFQHLATLPLTTDADLRKDPLSFLCVSQDLVARLVTLPTSGTTDVPKRIAFTERDLTATRQFFHWGMATLAGPESRVMILLPGTSPDSVGDLLARSLDGLVEESIPHGPLSDPGRTAKAIASTGADCLVGIPVQVLALARHPACRLIPRGQIRSVLLTGDYVPKPVVDALSDAWGASVFQHYGMTEMGFGGGVECAARNGYHLREADLFFEIVDSDTGAPVRGQAPGEIVFTTLDREAMPLIRYRTGDLAQWMAGPCPCGSRMPRLAKIAGRRAAVIRLDETQRFSHADLDEALFSLESVLDYKAQLRDENGVTLLTICLGVSSPGKISAAKVRSALEGAPALKAAIESGLLRIGPPAIEPRRMWTRGWQKRMIDDFRGKGFL